MIFSENQFLLFGIMLQGTPNGKLYRTVMRAAVPHSIFSSVWATVRRDATAVTSAINTITTNMPA
jgi:hypothetical protein